MTKRKALGKGLSALIPEGNSLSRGDETFFQCPIEDIEPNPYQPRQVFDRAELEAMKDSVKKDGILTPLLVTKTDQGYQLIAGERRWRAAQNAGLERVPVVVRETTPAESLELALVENIHREDLNPIEEAHAFKRWLEVTEATQEALAERLGMDRSTVTNFLRLLIRLLPPSNLAKGWINNQHSLRVIDSCIDQRIISVIVEAFKGG